MKNRKSIVNKAKELERRAKNLFMLHIDFKYIEDLNEECAQLYESAGRQYLHAKKPRKAINCYSKSVKEWENNRDLNRISPMELRVGAQKSYDESFQYQSFVYYSNRVNKSLRNIKRIKRVLKS